MTKRVFLYWLIVCFLLIPEPPVFAAEQVREQKTASEIQISAEDQKIIALMELLLKMEMLKDLDLMTAGEVQK